MSNQLAESSAALRLRRAAPRLDAMALLGIAAAAALSPFVVNDLLDLYAQPRLLPDGTRLWLGPPVVAVALAAVTRSGPLRRALMAFAVATATVGAAAFTAWKLDQGAIEFAFALPAISLAALVLSRRPAAGMALVVALTGGVGTLAAYTDVPYLKITYVVVLGLATAAVVRQGLGKLHAPVVAIPGAVLLAAFLAISVVQALLSNDVGSAFRTVRVDFLFMAVALLVAYGGWSAASRDALARAIVVIALAVGTYAMLRWFTGPSEPERELASLSPFNFVEGKLKLAGSLGTSASLAAWTGVAVPFCAALAIAWRGRWRWLAIGATGLCGFAVAGSQIRSGLIGAALGVAVVLAVHAGTRAFRGTRLHTAALTAVVAALAGLAVVAQSGIDDSATHRLTSVFSSEDTSYIHRVYKWRVALDDLADKPFGYGVGTATTGYGGATGAFSGSAAAAQSVDNGYLKIALEQGTWMAGLFVVALLTMMGGLARRAMATMRPDAAALATAGVGALAAWGFMLIAVAFQEGFPSLLAWTAIGLGLAPFARPQAPAD